MGRPSKLTPEVQKRITDAIRVGATYELAAQYGGVDYATFNNWMKAGEAAQTGRYFEFFQAVKSAEGDAAIKWLAVIDKASIEQWQAAAWKLERRYPREYGRQVHEVTVGKEGIAIPIRVVDYRHGLTTIAAGSDDDSQ